MEEQVSQTADEEQFELRIAKLEELSAELKQLEQSLGSGQEGHQSDTPPLARRRAQLVAKEARLEEEMERLEARRQLSRIQRRRIAGWLKTQRNELIQEARNLPARIEACPAAIAPRTSPLG